MQLELDIGVSALVFSILTFILVIVLYILVFTKSIPTASAVKHRAAQMQCVQYATTHLNKDMITAGKSDILTEIPTEIDGTLLSVGDTVLVKDELSTPELNGIYSIGTRKDGSLYLSKDATPDTTLVVAVEYGIKNSGSLYMFSPGNGTCKSIHTTSLSATAV